MINYLLLTLSVLLAVSKSSVYNVAAKRSDRSLFSTFGFNAATYAVAASVALVSLLALDGISLSASTVLCAVFYAAVVFSLQTVSVTAMSLGAMSLTSIAVMYGMIIPSLSGPVFWGEPFGALQTVGISLMLVSLWLLTEKGSLRKAAEGKRWLLLAAVAFLLSGMAGVAEKIHQSTDGKEERIEFVLLACLFMLALSLGACFLTRSGRNRRASKKHSLILLGLCSGLIVGIYSTVNLTLAGSLDSIIYYPVANGGAMLLTVAVSRVVFREPISPRQLVGVAIGLSGIIALSLPI